MVPDSVLFSFSSSILIDANLTTITPVSIHCTTCRNSYTYFIIETKHKVQVYQQYCSLVFGPMMMFCDASYIILLAKSMHPYRHVLPVDIAYSRCWSCVHNTVYYV